MALSGGGVARSLDCVSVLCVVASGGAPAADRVGPAGRAEWRVSPEPKKTACVAGAVDDGVCRRQACVAGVDGARRVSLRKQACVAGREGARHVSLRKKKAASFAWR